ncbi:hypothetical protein B0T14DRAFT_325294 [Immersiella caudata]|uniref:SET domain-containing protein n=1 Tax=Immersiella caudata TaxID=314043 RepID=A0AA39WA72_9PEZI|nr:hypothetical protein B0T14DRAFT_325294 [Immersiella caudata]
MSSALCPPAPEITVTFTTLSTMTRKTLALALSLSLLTSSESCPLDSTNPLQSPKPASTSPPQTCQKSQLRLSTPTTGFTPWTHRPTCTTVSPKGDELCVFTDATYFSGRGLSIVARPEVVDKFLQEGIFPGRQNRPNAKEKGDVKYQILPHPKMGTGLFVKPGKSYQAGEVILTDYPTLILPAEGFEGADADVLHEIMWQGLLQLPKEGRNATRNLAKSKEANGVDEIVDLVDTNAFTHEEGGGIFNVLYPLASRMNHACVPNAITRTNGTTLALEVIALAPIPSGAQIFNSYLDPSSFSSSAERAHALRATWSFSCGCDICSGKGVSASDARRREIKKTRAQLENSKGNPEEILRWSKALLTLMGEEGMVIPRGEYFELAAMASRYLGLNGEAKGWAKKAKKHWDVVLGEASEQSKAMGELERAL